MASEISTQPHLLSPKKAALIAGFGLLGMVLTAPVAEMGLLPDLFDRDPAVMLDNIRSAPAKLILALFCFIFTFILDVVVAWAIFNLFAPGQRAFAQVTTYFRLMYTAVAIVSLGFLLAVYNLSQKEQYEAMFGLSQLQAQVKLNYGLFRYIWEVAFYFFGIHLILVGVLAWKAYFVPKFVGIALIIAGLGYLLNNLGEYLMPDVDLSFLMITFFGELVFMGWLLIKGWSLPSHTRNSIT